MKFCVNLVQRDLTRRRRSFWYRTTRW